MLLKQRIIQEIETLPHANLLVVQQLIHRLAVTKAMPQASG